MASHLKVRVKVRVRVRVRVGVGVGLAPALALGFGTTPKGCALARSVRKPPGAHSMRYSSTNAPYSA